jgi:hypothetical protein
LALERGVSTAKEPSSQITKIAFDDGEGSETRLVDRAWRASYVHMFVRMFVRNYNYPAMWGVVYVHRLMWGGMRERGKLCNLQAAARHVAESDRNNASLGGYWP